MIEDSSNHIFCDQNTQIYQHVDLLLHLLLTDTRTEVKQTHHSSFILAALSISFLRTTSWSGMIRS